MNKVVEYMAMGRPIVSFDLTEARVSAGEAAVYATGDEPCLCPLPVCHGPLALRQASFIFSFHYSQ
jgi:hypothetical protein